MKKFLFLTIIITALIVAGYVSSIILIKDMRASRAATMSQYYVSGIYPEFKIVGAMCEGEDTNDDSYVSCDVSIRKGEDEATTKILKLACPTMWKSYTGNNCKERAMGIVGQ